MVPLRSQRLAAKRNSPLRSGIVRQRLNDRTGRQNTRRQRSCPRTSTSRQGGSPSKEPRSKNASIQDNEAPDVPGDEVLSKTHDNDDEKDLEDNGSRNGIAGNEQEVIPDSSVVAGISKRKERGGCSLRSKLPTKGGLGDLNDNDLSVSSPSIVSTDVPNVNKRSCHIESTDSRMFTKSARISTTAPTRGRASAPSRGRASYQGRSSIAKSVPPIRERVHENSPRTPNDSTICVPHIDNTSEGTSEQSFQIQVERLKRKLTDLTESYDLLSSNHNELKVKYEKLETDLLNEHVLRKALQMNVENLTHTLNQTEIKLKGLEKINVQLQNQHEPVQRGCRFRGRLLQTMDRKYFSFVLALEKRISKWATNQTMEVVDRDDEFIVRDWKGRAEIVDDLGVKVNGVDEHVVPTPKEMILNSTNPYYIKTYSSIHDVIHTLVTKLLREDDWKYLAADNATKKETLDVICSNHIIRGRVRQLLTDNLSTRKRDAKDSFLSELKYYRLLTFQDKNNDCLTDSKESEISLIQSKLLKENSMGIVDLSWWRRAPIQDIRCVSENGNDDDVGSPSDDEEDSEFSPDNPVQLENNHHPFGKTLLGVFFNQLSVAILHKFLGFNPSMSAGHNTEVSFLCVPRLDAWLVTVIQMFVVSEKRGGGRQKEYADKYFKNFILATAQFVASVRLFVQYWFPHELEVPSTSECRQERMDSFLSLDREATVIVRSKQFDCIFIAVKSEWFSQYITPLIGTVHDCYIASISDDWSDINLHGVPFEDVSCLGGNNHEGDNVSDVDDALPMESDDTPDNSTLTEPLAPLIVPPMPQNNQ